jgi:hypothetical protein
MRREPPSEPGYIFKMEARAYVHEADVILADGIDPRAVGAAVTVALCGHWEHDGPCPWPHHNHIDGRSFRTIFIAPADEELAVRRLIQGALHGNPDWRVDADRARDVALPEEELAAPIAASAATRTAA